MFHRYKPLAPLVEKQKKIVRTAQHYDTCSSSESDKLEEFIEERPNFDNYSYPDDYWKFIRAVKYLSYGRPLLTSLALIIATDCDFKDPVMLKSLKEHRILNILLNFLQSNDKRLQAICLRFLMKLSKIRQLRHEIVYLDGIPVMVGLLQGPQIDLSQAAAETIMRVSDFHKAWTAVRKAGGLPLLASMLYVPKVLLYQAGKLDDEQQEAVIKAGEAAGEALFVVCKCHQNQIEFMLSGGLQGCREILKTSHTRLCTLVLQIIQRCASQKCIRLAIENSNMLEDFRVHFYSEDQNLMQAAAQCAFKCAEGEQSKQFFGKEGFVDKLYEIIQTSSFHTDFELMASISGALWKSAENEENVKRIQTLNAAPLLIQLLTTQPVNVQTHIVACLSCCLSNPQIRATVRKNNGIEALIGLLHTTHPPLIMHLNKALSVAASDNDCLAILEKHNALRLIWSHLKNEDAAVVTNTAWQLAAILKNMENSSKYVRSLVGGIQVLMECLKSDNTRVQTAVCALIVVLCKDINNLRILSDYQVVDSLSELTNTNCRRLRYHLCMAITACCGFKDNREEFAEKQVVYPLIRMLKSKSPVVKGAATHALHQMAFLPRWCAVMYNTPEVYDILLAQMKSKDKEIQESSAGIIQKMRIFALNRDGNVPEWMIKKNSLFFSNPD